MVTNEFRILSNNKVLSNWEPQLVVNTGLYSYIDPNLNPNDIHTYTCVFGKGDAKSKALPTDLSLDSEFMVSSAETEPKTEYKSAFGKAIAIFEFEFPPTTQREDFNQIGMKVDGVLFSKLVYINPLFLLAGETIRVQYRITLQVNKLPTLTDDGLFKISSLTANWTTATPWSAVPKGFQIDQSDFTFNNFDSRLSATFKSGVNATNIVIVSHTDTSVTHEFIWDHTVGHGTYQSIWVKDVAGRCIQIGFPDTHGVFKNDMNRYSCLLTLSVTRGLS